MPTTPLLLYDNYLDTVQLYPGGALDASEQPQGFEAMRVADYRRDRTYWQPATDGGGVDHYVRVKLPTAIGARGVDYVMIDRDSTLFGRTVYLEGSADGAAWTVSQALNVPAAAAVGGDPTMPAMAQTEEGVAWSLAGAALAARLWWRLRIPYVANYRPIITGLMFGLRTQLLGYSNVFDEDAGERTQSTEVSTAGYRSSTKAFSYRVATLGLETIGSTEYDGTMRAVREALFARQAPWMLFMDYATRPERGWLFEVDGTTWGMPKTRVLRNGQIKGREVGAKIA